MSNKKISCQQAMDALYDIDNDLIHEADRMKAYFTVEEFIKQVDDLMKVRNMTIPMLLQYKERK